MNPIKKSIAYGRNTLTLETGEVARQSGGAVMVSLDDTVVLVTTVARTTAKAGQDFFPLTVDYQEKTFAAGKIPGGFFRREGRPSEKETLTSRLIDRPIRPLFPDGFYNEVQVPAIRGAGLDSSYCWNRRDGRADPRAHGVRAAEQPHACGGRQIRSASLPRPQPLPRPPPPGPALPRLASVVAVLSVPDAGAITCLETGGNTNTTDAAGEVHVQGHDGRGHRQRSSGIGLLTSGCRNCDLDLAAIGSLDIPTLSEWGLLIMAGLLGVLSLWTLRRRKDRTG